MNNLNEAPKEFRTVSRTGKPLVSAYDVIMAARKAAGNKKPTPEQVRQARAKSLENGRLKD